MERTKQYRRLLLDKLFPAWKIKNPVEWYWIKIASSNGEPVWSLSSTHRRCYEGLVLGWYDPGGGEKKVKVLEENKIFLASPVGHSRKPVLLGEEFSSARVFYSILQKKKLTRAIDELRTD